MEEARKRLLKYSYKKSPGFKIFGDDWQDVKNLCDELRDNRLYEQKLLRRIAIIGHKLSLPSDENTPGYVLILRDLQKKYFEQVKLVKNLEIEVAKDFNDLCIKKNINI